MFTINQNIFNAFFALSNDANILQVSIFVSNILIYILLVAVILFILLKSQTYIPHLFMALGTIGGAWVASKILKSLFHVSRPFITGNFLPRIAETGFSFPSSHATVFAALTVVVFSLDRTFGLVMCMCTLLIGISRMVLGVHYPLDILGGFVLGTLVGLCFVGLMRSRYAVAFFGKSL